MKWLAITLISGGAIAVFAAMRMDRPNSYESGLFLLQLLLLLGGLLGIGAGLASGGAVGAVRGLGLAATGAATASLPDAA